MTIYLVHCYGYPLSYYHKQMHGYPDPDNIKFKCELEIIENLIKSKTEPLILDNKAQDKTSSNKSIFELIDIFNPYFPDNNNQHKILAFTPKTRWFELCHDNPYNCSYEFLPFDNFYKEPKMSDLKKIVRFCEKYKLQKAGFSRLAFLTRED